MATGAELMATFEAAGVTVVLNATGDGLRLHASSEPPAELIEQIREVRSVLLDFLTAQAAPVDSKTYPDWAAIGAQAGYCGSCARWRADVEWGPFMGVCHAPAEAFRPEAPPLAIHVGHRCVVKKGWGYQKQ